MAWYKKANDDLEKRHLIVQMFTNYPALLKKRKIDARALNAMTLQQVQTLFQELESTPGNHQLPDKWSITIKKEKKMPGFYTATLWLNGQVKTVSPITSEDPEDVRRRSRIY